MMKRKVKNFKKCEKFKKKKFFFIIQIDPIWMSIMYIQNFIRLKNVNYDYIKVDFNLERD